MARGGSVAVPRFRLNTYGRRAISVAGPMAWNSLPDFILDRTSSTDCFRRLFKTYLLARYVNGVTSASRAVGVLNDYALYKSTHSLRVVSVLDSGAVRPGFKSQRRRCRVTVLGKLFTPVVPLFTKRRRDTRRVARDCRRRAPLHRTASDIHATWR